MVWTCTVCTLVNEDGKLCCVACGQQMPTHEDSDAMLAMSLHEDEKAAVEMQEQQVDAAVADLADPTSVAAHSGAQVGDSEGDDTDSTPTDDDDDDSDGDDSDGDDTGSSTDPSTDEEEELAQQQAHTAPPQQQATQQPLQPQQEMAERPGEESGDWQQQEDLELLDQRDQHQQQHQHQQPPQQQQPPLQQQQEAESESGSESDGSGSSTGSGTESSSDDDGSDEESADRGATKAYDPADYAHLNVSSEIQDLFDYIGRHKPHDIELDTHLKPFIPDFIPAVGDIDAFIKIPAPDGKADGLGLVVLDEPAAQQSDPTVLDLQLRIISKRSGLKPVTVHSISNAAKNPLKINTWIKNIEDLHRKKAPPTVNYSKNMPDIEALMQVWPQEMEQLLRDCPLPTADMDLDLPNFVKVVCAILDVPVYDKMTESLHVLFTLYSEFKNNAHFQQ